MKRGGASLKRRTQRKFMLKVLKLQKNYVKQQKENANTDNQKEGNDNA